MLFAVDRYVCEHALQIGGGRRVLHFLTEMEEIDEIDDLFGTRLCWCQRALFMKINVQKH